MTIPVLNPARVLKRSTSLPLRRTQMPILFSPPGATLPATGPELVTSTARTGLLLAMQTRGS